MERWESRIESNVLKMSVQERYNRAKEILKNAFPELDDERAEATLSSLKEGGIEALNDLRNSTNPVQLRKNANAFLKEWKKDDNVDSATA